MPRSLHLRNALLQLIFNAVSFDGIAINDDTLPVSALTVALHTASPGPTGDQSTNEIVYTGYQRISIARTSTGWVITDDAVSPSADINFDEMTAGVGGAATHASIGTGVANEMLYYGALVPNISVSVGVKPQIPATATITEDE